MKAVVDVWKRISRSPVDLHRLVTTPIASMNQSVGVQPYNMRKVRGKLEHDSRLSTPPEQLSLSSTPVQVTMDRARKSYHIPAFARFFNMKSSPGQKEGDENGIEGTFRDEDEIQCLCVHQKTATSGVATKAQDFMCQWLNRTKKFALSGR